MDLTSEQETRRFLSAAYKQDVRDTTSRALNNGTLHSSNVHRTFQISVKSATGSFKDECTQITMSFFDTMSKTFFGGTTQMKLSSAASTVFHCKEESTLLVFEALRLREGTEVVGCWGCLPASTASAASRLSLNSGTGQLLMVDQQTWPKGDPSSPLTLSLLCVFLQQSVVSLLPAGRSVSSSFLERELPSPFTAKINFMSVAAIGGALLQIDGEWQCLIVAHNTYMQLSAVVEVSFTLEEGKLTCREDAIVSELPLHPTTSLVFVVRFKGTTEPRFRVIGYAVIPIVAALPRLEDCDVHFGSRPLLSGPFSCEDCRLTSLYVEKPHELVNFELSVDVGLYDTPIRAERIEVHVALDVSKQPLASGSKVTRTSPAQPPNVPIPKSTPIEEPTSDPSAPKHPHWIIDGGVPGFTEPTHHIDVDVYKMLSQIVEELRSVKQIQEQLQHQFRSVPESSRFVDPRHTAKNQFLYSSPPEIVALAPRRVALPQAIRDALICNVAPILHPVSKIRIADVTEVLSTPLPRSHYSIRFDGITFFCFFKLPSKLYVALSFASQPMQHVGPITTRAIDCKEFRGSSFVLCSNILGSTGYHWDEPHMIPSLQLDHYKSRGTMYLHFFDHITGFYVTSATLKLSSFQRYSSCAATTTSLDVPLFEDLSVDRFPPNGVPLFAGDVGVVHVTLCCIGLSDSSPPKQKTAALDAHGSVIVAQKIPMDFGSTKEQSFVEPAATIDYGNIHSRRAQYVRSVLEQGAVNGGRLPPLVAELEFKLRFVERKRDEMKRLKIAETLRQRITVVHNVVLSTGRPQTVITQVANPFPQTTTFRIELPPTSTQLLRLHPSQSSTVSLGPHQAMCVSLIAEWKEKFLSEAMHGQCLVKSDKLDTMKVIDIHATQTKPIVDRRYEIFAAAGSTVNRQLFSRFFPPLNCDQTGKLGALCSYCRISDDCSVATSEAVVQEINLSQWEAWEQLSFTTVAPTLVPSKQVLLYLYEDPDCASLWETWEITITACTVFEAKSIPFGQTSSLTLPIVCDSIFSSEANLFVVPQTNCVAAKLSPRTVGASTYVLHAHRNNTFQKVLVTVPCCWPVPTYEQTIEVSLQEAAATLYRRLTFTNKEPEIKAFRVFSNYGATVQVAPRDFVLAASDSQIISISVDGLGGAEQLVPLWIFVNDVNDKSIETFLINIAVRHHLPLYL